MRRSRVARLARTAALAALPALAAAAEPPLAIDVQTPVFAGSELAVEAIPGGALARQPLVLHLIVDDVSIERFQTEGGRQWLRARSARLTPGWHEIAVKTGSVRATARVRVWPGWLPAAITATALAAVGLGVALWRRRRRRR